MANVPVKINEEITAPDTSENTVILTVANEKVLSKPITTAYITVTSGSIQFSVGETINTHKAWGTDSKIILSFLNGVCDIRFKASSITDKFVIHV